VKVSIIKIKSDLHNLATNNVSAYLTKAFLGIGITLGNVVETLNNPQSIFNALNFVNSDFIFIIGEPSSQKNYIVKKAIAEKLQLKLVINNDIKQSIAKYYANNNIPLSQEVEHEYYIPAGATPLNDSGFGVSGFIDATNKTKYIYLPGNVALVENLFKTTIKNIMMASSTTRYNAVYIKTFGISEIEIHDMLEDLIKNIYKITFLTHSNGMEATTIIRYNATIDDDIINPYITKSFERLSKFVYADEDVSLAKRVYDLLELSNKKVAISESVTAGAITMDLATYDENNSVIKYSVICPNTESKLKLLGASKSIFDKYGETSIEAVYEMAAGLLETSGADYIVCTTGFDKLDANNKNVAYIAVGNIDGIHVYKNTFVGSQQEMIKSITQTSLFYLIKNIRQNDLLFSQTTL